VAIKVLFPQFAGDPAFVERFRREAQSAANLNHPNIVAVYDWGQEQGTYFIVMEYVEGRSLAEILRSEGMLHPDRAADVATDVAAALSFAHRNGVVHRDIKPGNILIAPSGQVKVTDFGIARAFGGAGADTNLTQTGSVMGTATYFSPEQAQGQPVDPRSDLYSLGVVLYEMVASRPPFSGDSPVAIAYQHVQQAPTPPSQVNAGVPRSIEAVIMRLLAKDPGQRYPSAEDLRADLRRFREGQTPLALGAVGAAGVAAGAAAAVPALAATRAPAGPPPGGYDDVDDYEAYEEPRSRTGWFLAALVVLLLVLAGLLVVFANSLGLGDDDEDTGPVDVEVPGVIELNVDAATQILEDAGFVVSPEFSENEDFDANVVFDQDPLGGTILPEGSTVTIFVSSGTEAFPMPDLEGFVQADAVAALQQAGLTVGEVTTEPSEDFGADEVIRTVPPAGDPVAPGTSVDLVVSEGPEVVAVPDVSGSTPEEAFTVLQDAGFRVAEQTQASSSVPAGTVIGTQPAAGTEVEPDSTVTILVSSGPQISTVPGVVNQTQASAEASITGAGFALQVQFASSSSVPEGRVIDQDPDPGTELEVGSPVAILVSTGPDSTTTTSSTTSTTATTEPTESG
jgi:serine/threonine-protein kinase